MAKKIDIAGELNAATTEGIIADSKQVRYGEEEDKTVEQKLKELSDDHKDYEDLGQYTDSPEFIRAYTDAEGKFLWGIRIDGTVEWAKGVPTPVKEALRELESKIKDAEESEDIEAIKSDIESINAKFTELEPQLETLKEVTDTFSFQDSPEFVSVVTDADGKVLFGLTAEGKPYFPKNTMYSVESNQEFLAAWLDSAGHVLFGLRTDGSTYVAKADFIEKIEKIQQLLKDNGIGDDELKQRVEALENNFTNLQDTFNNTFSIISNDEWLHAVVDAEGKLLFGIKAENGEVVMPKQDTYKVVSNDEWLAAWLDATDKILFGVKADGTFWAAKSNFTGGGNYDEQITQINNTLQQVQDQLKDIDTSGVANTVFTVIDDAEERLAVTTDKDERVISYRDKDGVLHEKKGVDTSKYYLNGKERNFVDQTEVAGFAEEAIDDAISNGDISLENINGVSNHNTPNLLIASEMQKTFNDGVNSFTPPNAGYEMSNPIECQAGDWFTRTGTATGMVVVTDENDKNGTRLFNADGSTLGSTFQIPADMTWVRYIRMAAEVTGAEDGSVVICKGKEAYTGDNRGKFLTIDLLRIQKANLPKDIKYLKSSDGKYWEVYVDESHQLQIREIDPDIITELPADFPVYEITGDYGDYFDTWLSFGLPYLMERNKNGVLNYYNCGNDTANYADFKKVKNSNEQVRYVRAYTTAGYVGPQGEKNLTIYDKNFLIIDTDIIPGDWSSFDSHDFVYFDDNHVAVQIGTAKNVTIDLGEGEKLYKLWYFKISELKKKNGVWTEIGSFSSLDYPKLMTDEFGIYSPNETLEVHPNTIFIDYDGNYLVNMRNNDSFIKIKRTENDDGTVTIGSKTHNYDEAIIGRVGGKYNSGYLDNKRVIEEGFEFTDTPTSLSDRSIDEWPEWKWYHAHDVSYWGMKNIGGHDYPTYLLFDNNMWTGDSATSNYIDTNERNNTSNNPTLGSDSHYLDSKTDSGGSYDTLTVSRVVQLSIDWDNHLIKDYKVYQIPKKYSFTRGGAQMFNEGVLLINWSDQKECGVYDFNDEQTQVEGHTYKNGKELWHVSNLSSFRVYGLKK